MESGEKPAYEQFVYAMMAFMDEREKDDKDLDEIDRLFDYAQSLFDRAIGDAVRAEMERIELEIIVKK